MIDATTRYRSYLLTVLLIVFAFNGFDRVALGVVMQDMKGELALSDTELGLLSGIAFALFYAVMGIPIARWADRGNRVTIISLTAAVWSISVALCAAVTSFTQLLLVRVCVAVGEAGCVPPAHSLIADYFPRAERPRALSRYMLGGPLAFTVGYFAAGWLNQLYGWRTTFVILGLPGVVLALIAWITLKEPRRLAARRAAMPVDSSAAAEEPAPVPVPGLKEVFATLLSNPSFRHLLFCFSTWSFFGYGILQWLPTFLIRSHGLETGAIGTALALIYGIGGGVGLYLGGEVASRYARGNERLQLRLGAGAFVLFGAITAIAFAVSNDYLAFATFAIAAIGGNLAQGPMLATLQTLVQPRMRATSIAIIYLFSNLIGLGLGPLAVGALSDAFQPWAGQESLRYSLIALCPGYLWAGWHLWRASNTVVRDLAAALVEHPRVAPVQAAFAGAE